MYQGGQNSPTTVEFDVEGDTVTFAFYSDSSGAGYGYYAVIEEAQAGSYNYTSQIRSKDIVLLTDDITVFAKYSSTKIVFPVHFDSNGGSDVADQEVEFGGKVAEPPVPTKSGYKLEAWYYDENLTTPWDFETDTVDAETTLYAKWDLDSSYTITVPAVINMTDSYNHLITNEGDGPLTRYGIFDIYVEGTGGTSNDFRIGIECDALTDGSGHSTLLDGYQQFVDVEKDEEFTSSDISDYPNSFTGDDPAVVMQRLDSTYYKTIVLNRNDFKFTDNVLLHGVFPEALGEYNGKLTLHFAFVPKVAP